MPSVHAVALALHLLAAVFWVGGMAVMHFVVRPAAAATLEPPARLAFMHSALARLLAAVAVAVVVLLASGAGMIGTGGGLAAQPWPVHAMLALGLVMAVLFVVIVRGPQRRLGAAVGRHEWTEAATALTAIRRLVAVNLALGVLVVVLASGARAA